MRLVLLIVILLSMAGVAYADEPVLNDSSCYSRLFKEKIIENKITIIKVDSTVISGVRPIKLLASELLVRSMINKKQGGDFSIPLAEIATINYAKPNSSQWAFPMLCMTIGAVVGIVIGADNAPKHSDEMFDNSGFDNAIQGGVIGVAAGAVLGIAISWNLKTNVSLRCR